MIGTIIGDIVGSPYESNPYGYVDNKEFPLFTSNSRFTDDTVLTCAIADALLCDVPFEKKYIEWVEKYPDFGYGGSFYSWYESSDGFVMDSYSNGCLMRSGPIAYMFNDVDKIIELSRESVKRTHNHVDAINYTEKFLLLTRSLLNGVKKEHFKEMSELSIHDSLTGNIQDVQFFITSEESRRKFDCRTTLTKCFSCFYNSNSFEDSIRNAVLIRGDTDTQAAITGTLSEAFYGTKSIPTYMVKETKNRLPSEMIGLVNKFYKRIGSEFKL